MPRLYQLLKTDSTGRNPVLRKLIQMAGGQPPWDRSPERPSRPIASTLTAVDVEEQEEHKFSKRRSRGTRKAGVTRVSPGV